MAPQTYHEVAPPRLRRHCPSQDVRPERATYICTRNILVFRRVRSSKKETKDALYDKGRTCPLTRLRNDGVLFLLTQSRRNVNLVSQEYFVAHWSHGITHGHSVLFLSVFGLGMGLRIR